MAQESVPHPLPPFNNQPVFSKPLSEWQHEGAETWPGGSWKAGIPANMCGKDRGEVTEQGISFSIGEEEGFGGQCLPQEHK